jgi:hypothetical protein
MEVQDECHAELKSFLITFCSGIAAILAWQSYGDAAKQIIAGSYPQLGWLAPRAAPIAYSAHDTIGLAAQAAASPDEQRLNAISLDLDAMRQNVDRIAVTQEQITRSVDQLTTGQQRMTRNIDQLTAGQERITREISKLQAVEQQIKPPPRSASASARKPVARSSPAPTVR